MIRAALIAAGVMLAAEAAIAADAGTPVGANPFTAYGEVGGGWTDRHSANGASTTGLTTLSGAAYANLSFAERWNLEVEGRGYAIDRNGNSDASDIGGFVHLYWRDPDRFALGAFAGYDALTLYTNQHGDMVSGGAEAQLYLGNLTLFGQAATYRSSASTGWLYFDGYFLRGAARYFATPNLRLQFDAQWATLNNSDHTSALSLVGTAEYKPDNLPFSGFARVRWDNLDPDLNQQMDTTTYLFGLRAYFGTDTLRGNDRNGPAFDVLPFPPLYALNFG